jgi:hypothetical protein
MNRAAIDVAHAGESRAVEHGKPAGRGIVERARF